MTGEPAVVETGAARQTTILVVDDAPANLALMSKLLRERYRVRIANGGEQALRIAAAGSPPDLILLDIMMPGMDGYEVCRQLKRNPATENIPVIFLTAKTDDGDEEKGLGLGAVDYITKPISAPIVMARVKNHLALKAMANFLQEKNLELQGARSVADKANLAKSDFLSGMSHELRSPLNGILGFAQLMRSESPPPTDPQLESIDQILRSGWYLLKLINEILDLAQIESGKLALSLEPVLLADVIGECQAMIEPQAQQSGIRMHFAQISASTHVRADSTRLKQILINLLSNAIKYNRPGGEVFVECGKGSGERLRISVRDTGAGLPPDMLQLLFKPFNRLGRERGAVEGTGIGLVMSKRVVELMGGAIGVQSSVGVGSVFWFELDEASAPQPAVASAAPAAAAQADIRHDGAPRTLLYIEDNAANLKLVERLIARRSDLRLLSTANGMIGIEMARSEQPALILMDINLPGISGYEVLQILRDDPATAHIPAIAVSANAMPRDIEKGLRAGFFRYLTKPIQVDQFMETLDLALEHAARETARST